MFHRIEKLVAAAWNRLMSKHSKAAESALLLGHRILDGQVTEVPVGIPLGQRPEHIAILGKTGTGKSSLLKHFVLQDITADRGFVFFDLHGDIQSFLLAAVAEQERIRNCDLSGKLIVIEPGDSEYSVGLNVLEPRTDQQNFVQIAEFAQTLKQRWHLDAFGPRTEELLRNALYVLSDNQLTFLELAPLLTNTAFRATCLAHVSNTDVRSYFENRYDPLSGAMQTAFREAVLNKTTAFTTDPHFRHILGQQQSSFSLVDAMDKGYWIVLNLDKGRLGEQVSTLGSLFMTKLKNAVFARRSRKLFTIYCDELQNLASFDTGMDTLFSESRKYALSVCSANQWLAQYPPSIQSAILAVGTHVLFQLSSDDATKMAAALGGGRQLGELLRYLPHRQAVIKSGHRRWTQVLVPEVRPPKIIIQALYNRCRQRWARPRTEIETAIRLRSAAAVEVGKALDGWN